MIGFFKVQHLFFSHKKKFPLVCSFFLSFLSSIFLFSFRGWEIWYNYCFFIICHKFLFFGLKWKINKVSLDFIYIINIKIKCSQVRFRPEFRSLIIQKEFQSLLEAKIQQSAVFLVRGKSITDEKNNCLQNSGKLFTLEKNLSCLKDSFHIQI